MPHRMMIVEMITLRYNLQNLIKTSSYSSFGAANNAHTDVNDCTVERGQ